MTVTIDLDQSAPTVAAPRRTTPGSLRRLVRSEFRKLTSTHTWWILGAGVILGTVVSIMYALLQAADDLAQTTVDVSASDRTPAIRIIASNVFTSGQFLGALCTMLLAILLMTNEFYHQTVTTTFLITPRRTPVMVAKSLVAAGAAVLFWLVATVIDVIAGIGFFHSRHLSNHLGDPAVIRTMLTNLLVYALWALFGVGLGALLRNQVWATAVATITYTIGFWTTWLVLDVLSDYLLHNNKLDELAVLMPTVAAQVAVASRPLFAHSPSAGLGIVVMLAEGLLMAILGAYLTRRRDIS